MLNEMVAAMFLLTSVFTGTSSGVAQTSSADETQVLSLADVLERAPQLDADVITARSELAAAERELRRVTGDPLALRLARLEAQQRVAGERADLASARSGAEREAAGLYFGALEADDALTLARTRLGIARTAARAAQIRFEAGQIGALERTRAQNDLSAAEREVTSAEQERTFAYGELASLLGREVDLDLLAPFAPPPIPPFEEVAARLGENAALGRAEQAVELARLRLELTDSAYSPRRDVEAAEDALRSAQTQRRELRRSLDLSVRGAYNAALAARDAYQNAQAALRSAEDEFEAQELRFEAGDVSRLTLAESERNVAESAAASRRAQYALAEAVTQLELVVQGSASSEVESE